MANVITAHTLISGSRNLILQFNVVGDSSGEYTDYILLDLDNYTSSPTGLADWTDLKVMKVTYTVGDGVSFRLKFGSVSSNHKLFLQTPELENGMKDWTDIGGLSTTLNDFDGTVRITTLGLDAAADELSVTLWMKKKNKNSYN